MQLARLHDNKNGGGVLQLPVARSGEGLQNFLLSHLCDCDHVPPFHAVQSDWPRQQFGNVYESMAKVISFF